MIVRLKGKMTADDAPIYLLAGPTASGKSAKALAWAQRRGGIVLNADSMQLYADVPILTARPDACDLARADHVLYGHLGPRGLWSAGDWLRAATPYLEAALAGGRPVCVVGGTGLYFNSLVFGLADVPDISEAVRLKARAAYGELGEPSFRDMLGGFDPSAEARIMANDQQRLSRAYEVWLETGIALSDWQKQTTAGLSESSYCLEIMTPEREWLYGRCDERLGVMLANGALDQVGDLLVRGLANDWPIMRVLGLRQFADHLRGDMSLSAALDLARQKTRNYAKRQMTWFRNQFSTEPS